MSADNGIYILETSGPEYRVAYAQAIDNITYHPDRSDSQGWNEKQVRLYFSDSEVFNTEEEAFAEAQKIADEWERGSGWLEYGICGLDFSERDFPCT